MSARVLPRAYPAHAGHAAYAPPRPRALATLWWLHPCAALAMVATVYACFPFFDFSRVVPKAYIPGAYYLWGGVLLAVMAIGMLTMTTARRPGPPTAGFDVPRWATALLLVCTVLAYVVWFMPLIQQPGLLLEILGGRRSNLRNVAPTLPGVTTMTQFGVAYVIVHAAMLGGRGRRVAGWEHAGTLLVFALGALRSVAWGERLALMELAVTWAIARFAFVQVHGRGGWRLFALLPLAAPPLLYLTFTGTEAFRSWEYYRNEYSSIWAFSFDRLLAYYATASNNGIGLLTQEHGWPHHSGRYVAEWLYLMPGLGETLRGEFGDISTRYVDFLDQYARPEFNNPSGLFPVVFDIGFAGSALYFTAVGMLVGRAWASWRQRRPAGVLCYPVAMLFLFELLRFNYLASTRFFPIALALLLLWAVARPLRPAGGGLASW